MQFRSGIDYARAELRHGNARSRSIFLLRALTWPLRRLWRRATRAGPGRLAPGGRRRDAANLQVAVVTGGGLGDLLSTSGFIERFYCNYGRLDIDIFYDRKQYLDFVFGCARYVRDLLPLSAFGGLRGDYDLVVTIHRTVAYEILDPRRVARLAKSLLWCKDESDRRNHDDFAVHVREMPYLDGDLARRAVFKGLERKSLLGYSGAVSFGRDDWVFVCPDIAGLDIFRRLALRPGQYVTIHDGFDTSYRSSNPRSTKQWPVDHWNALMRSLHECHPQLKLVQLGGIHSQPFDGVDVQLISNTDFNEAAWLLKYAACHIDNESGMVRLCREMGGRSVVVFGPTDPDFFGFSENTNLRPHRCGGCFWSTRDWLDVCPRGLKVPDCTSSITVEEVLKAVGATVNGRRPMQLVGADPCLFETESLRRDAGVLQDIFQRTGLPAVPISRHAQMADNALYLHASKQWEYLYVLRMLRKHVGSLGEVGCRVADLGGGRGALSAYLAAKGAKVTVFDLDYLWDHQGDLAVEGRFFDLGKRAGFDVRYGSIFNVPAPDESFDVVTCVSVVEHVPFKEFAFREALRILKPHGFLILTFDIADDVQRLESGARVEIFSPGRIEDLRQRLSIAVAAPCFSSADIAASAAAVQIEGVAGLPKGLTVGGLVIVKSLAQAGVTEGDTHCARQQVQPSSVDFAASGLMSRRTSI